MKFPYRSIVVKNGGVEIDHVTKAVRSTDDNGIGVEYRGLFYYLVDDRYIEISGEWRYLSDTKIVLDPEELILRASVQPWILSFELSRPYAFLSGSKAFLDNALKQLANAGIVAERWGPSFFQSAGRDFDWFIRLPATDVGDGRSEWKIDRALEAALSQFEDAAPSEAMFSASELHLRIVEAERQLAAEIDRRDKVEAEILQLQTRFQSESQRLAEAVSFLKAALCEIRERPTATRVELDPTVEALRVELDQALSHWALAEDSLRVNTQALQEAQAQLRKLEADINRNREPSNATPAPGGRKGAVRELEMALEVFAPNLRLLKDSVEFLTVEVVDRADLYAKLRTLDTDPKSLKCKRVHAADSWLELHFSTGLARDGRIYFKRFEHEHKPYWGVLVSDQAAQQRDCDWIAQQ